MPSSPCGVESTEYFKRGHRWEHHVCADGSIRCYDLSSLDELVRKESEPHDIRQRMASPFARADPYEYHHYDCPDYQLAPKLTPISTLKFASCDDLVIRRATAIQQQQLHLNATARLALAQSVHSPWPLPMPPTRPHHDVTAPTTTTATTSRPSSFLSPTSICRPPVTPVTTEKILGGNVGISKQVYIVGQHVAYYDVYYWALVKHFTSLS